MRRPSRTSDRQRRASEPEDDYDPGSKSKAGMVAVIIIVIGVGLLVWVMQGGPVAQAPAPPPPASSSTQPTAPTPLAVTGNQAPRAEIRLRVEPKKYRVEYSGTFSDDLDAADEGKLTYAWDFGDGTTLTDAQGVKIYGKSGTYTVTLTVTDPAGATSTAQRTVEIGAIALGKPTHRFTGKARTVEVPGLLAWYHLGRVSNFAEAAKHWQAATAIPDATSVGLKQRPADTDFAMRWTGYIEFPAAGVYGLALTSDDGSRLILEDKAVIVMDTHQPAKTKEATVEVTAGLVPFTVEYFQGSSSRELSLRWEGPGLMGQEIPASAFFKDAE
jgi:hypothetical protein